MISQNFRFLITTERELNYFQSGAIDSPSFHKLDTVHSPYMTGFLNIGFYFRYFTKTSYTNEIKFHYS